MNCFWNCSSSFYPCFQRFPDCICSLFSTFHPKDTNLDDTAIEIIYEIAVIIGSLANGELSRMIGLYGNVITLVVGSLTLRPLLFHTAPERIIRLIRTLNDPQTPISHSNRLIAPLVRALRNVLFSTADLSWGQMWGVGAEKKVVSTGLLGYELIPAPEGKGKATDLELGWRNHANRALAMVFEVSHLWNMTKKSV